MESDMNAGRLDLLVNIEGYVPPVTALSQTAADRIFAEIRRKYHIKKTCASIFQFFLYTEMDSDPALQLIPGREVLYLIPEKECAMFEQFVKQKQITEQCVLLTYNDFHSPEEIDKVELKEVISHFDFYWYPAAEDVLIYPESLSWMIGIRHDYTLFYNSPASDPEETSPGSVLISPEKPDS